MIQSYLPEGCRITNPENYSCISTLAGLENALDRQLILEAPAILCDSDLNLHIQLGNMRGIIPREEVQYCAPGEEIKDIAILTRVGKTVCFKITGFSREQNGELRVMLSRKAAQQECMLNYISDLRAGDILPARITHLENFGAFVDIGCGIISLLSIDCFSVSRISHPSDRFRLGQQLPVIIKSIDQNGRIYVTHRELLGTWEENAAQFSVGQTVAGIVRSVESYGIFVELTPNLAGLAEPKPNVHAGQTAAVYIKNMIAERMKIKLILIDAHDAEETPTPFRYFIDPGETAHLDHWRYSPDICNKIIETVFR